MQTELQNGFDKDKVIADLQAKKTSEPLLQPPLEPAAAQMPTTKNIEGQMVSVGDPVSQENATSEPELPPLIPQSSVQQPPPLDKSSDKIAQYFRKDELPEPMIVSDSESEDDAEESDIQFTPRQSNRSYRQNYKRKLNAKKTEDCKDRFRHDILKNGISYTV